MAEIQSLARGLMILEKMAEAPDGVSITDLAEEFDVDKGSISRLLQTLAAYGFAEKDPVSRKFVLGPQIVRGMLFISIGVLAIFGGLLIVRGVAG